MSAIIVIEIVVGIVVFAAAVRFAVRDTRQRIAAAEHEAAPVETAKVPARDSEPAAEQAAEPELTEVNSAEAK
ncbi:MAG TPA: hypothetical protein VN748_21180 [Pseudonocardiaceae bacterium]|jgi:hypothetical protein|nr:hypothetical protein [Pseudonocardiaceae bacterium]